MTKTLPATLLCDFYKVGHKNLYPKGTEKIYSTFTPRSSKYGDNVEFVVAFGIQAFVKKYLIDYFNDNFFKKSEDEVAKEYERVIKHTLGNDEPDSSHIRELHQLGYLPIKLKALKEGTKVPIKVPMLTIENTHPRFFWLTNYLETLLSTELWQSVTSATKAYRFRKLLDKYAMETVGNTDSVGLQGHDFSMRGMSSLESAQLSGSGHLLSFVGTDSIPAILHLENYYNADVEKELVGSSVVATEHSIMSSLTPADGDRDEYETYKYLITEANPKGIMSIVSDTYDFWKVVGEVLPKLKDEIMNRDGTIVIRPDSGIPEDILCGRDIENLTDDKYIETLNDAKDCMYEIIMDKLRGETPHGEHGDSEPSGEFQYKGKYYYMKIDVFWNRYDKQYYYVEDSKIVEFEEFKPQSSDLGLIESLWNIFGGTVNDKGYKVLDPHIGSIYGDSINYDRADEICKRLKRKGFASSNVIMGLGSYFYQMNTRDTFGFAMKATYAVINGQEQLLFKDPKTDDGTKRSQRGKVAVLRNKQGEITYEDGLNNELYAVDELQYVDLLEHVFVDGTLVRDESLSEIRKKLWND